MPSPEQERLDAISASLARVLRRLDEFDRRLAQLESGAAIPAQTASMPGPETPTQEIQPNLAKAPVAAEHTLASRPPSPVKPPLETRVGLTILNRVGVITLVLGIAFFFKWAVDNNWIGALGRVTLGILASFLAIVAAELLWRKKQEIFAAGITGTGVAVLYLSLYAAFGFYHLIAQSFAFFLLFCVTAAAVALSLRYRAQAVAALGFFGGYLTPLLLSRGEDRSWFLFSYLLLLDGAALALTKRRRWLTLEPLCVLATVLLYGRWLFGESVVLHRDRFVGTLALFALYALFSQLSIRPLFLAVQFLSSLAAASIWTNSAAGFFLVSLSLAAAGLLFGERRRSSLALSLTFSSFWIAFGLWSFGEWSKVLPVFVGITIAFLLFLIWQARLLAIGNENVTAQRLSVLSTNGAVYYAALYALLNPKQHAYLGLLAVAVAGVYFACGAYLSRVRTSDSKDRRAVVLSWAVALCFVALAIPIQFTGFTITVAWSFEAAALTWIGLRFASRQAVLGSLVIFVLIALRLVLFDGTMFSNPRSYALLWNTRFLTFAVASASFLLAARWALSVFPRVALAEYFAGHVFLLYGLSLEVIGWAERTTPSRNLLSVETVALSILFAVYALLLISLGVAARTALNRLAGLGLIGIVICKLYLFDVWQLERVYRISAFVALGVLLIATSFLYSRFRQWIERWRKDDDLPRAN